MPRILADMAKILLINGHQKIGGKGGRLNESLTGAASAYFKKRGCDVKTTIVDNGYSVPGELEKIAWADAVIFFTPVYWMSIPWAFKKYIDEVYMAGYGKIFAGDGRTESAPEKNYGTGGLLKSRYMLVTTWNARGVWGQKRVF